MDLRHALVRERSEQAQVSHMNKKLVLTVMAMTTVAAAWVGCGSSSNSGSTGGTGGTKATTTTTTTTTTTVSTGVGGSGGGFGGGTGGTLPAISCNPVTNAGCTMAVGLGGAGGSEPQACDYTQDMNTGAINGFTCYFPPNDAKLCDACDPTEASPPYCTGGTTCYPTNASGTTGQCAKYCCSDADCGSGTCMTTGSMGALFPPATMLGLCVAGTSDGGTGGAASDGGASGPFACDAPAVSPSNGSCVTVGM
jgi:hypothetical protein